MSYRELRSFAEVMKSLGYPRLISIDNFRLPNFELVADCLYWLMQRYSPECDIPDEISTEQQRVRFLQAAAQLMLGKARMKLNIKKLYAADGLAVKELLKLAQLLHRARASAAQPEEDAPEAFDLQAAIKGIDLRELKQCAAEIVRCGAALHDALGQEPELREARARAVAGHLDTSEVERGVMEAIAQVQDGTSAAEAQLQELAREEAALAGKLEKRRAELERSEKRLATLAAVRPAYMDEYERLQGELQVLYGQYVDRLRNLDFLEAELAQYHRAEQEQAEAAERRLRRLQRRMADEELRILRGEAELDEANISAAAAGESDEDSELLTGEDSEPTGGRGFGGDDLIIGRDAAGKDMQQQRQQMMMGPKGGRGGGGGGMMGAGEMMGTLTGGDFEDDGASIDEDSDDGQAFLSDEEGQGQQQQQQQQGGYYGGGDEEEGLVDDDDGGDVQSDESGF